MAGIAALSVVAVAERLKLQVSTNGCPTILRQRTVSKHSFFPIYR